MVTNASIPTVEEIRQAQQFRKRFQYRVARTKGLAARISTLAHTLSMRTARLLVAWDWGPADVEKEYQLRFGEPLELPPETMDRLLGLLVCDVGTTHAWEIALNHTNQAWTDLGAELESEEQWEI